MSEQIKVTQSTELSGEDLDNVAGGVNLDVRNKFDVTRKADATAFEQNENGTSFVDLSEVEQINNKLDIEKES